MKRIAIFSILVLLISSLFYSHSPVFADSNKNYSDESLGIAKKVLLDLNIWEDFDETEPYLTRAEVAAYMCMTVGSYKLQYADSYFPKYLDVTAEHWASDWIPHIDFIRDPLGFPVMSGDGNGYFRPDDYITYQEFVKTIVTWTGWSAYAVLELDGYPYGFWKVSKMLGINPFDESKMTQYITKDDAVFLMYKSIIIPHLYTGGFTSDLSCDIDIDFPHIDNASVPTLLSQIYNIRKPVSKIDDDSFYIDGKVYYGNISDIDFSNGDVLCLCLYMKYNDRNIQKNKIIGCYSITSTDFDKPKLISDELKNWDHLNKRSDEYRDFKNMQ